MLVNSYKIAILFTAVTTLSACSTMKNWFSNKDPEQTKLEQVNDRKELKLPAGYTNPKRSQEFEIAAIKPTPDDFALTSPTSVLVIFDKSWINEDDPHRAKIMLERPDLIDDLPGFVQSGFDSYASLKSLKVEKVSETKYRVTKPLTVQTGFWFWKSDEVAEEYVFDLNIVFQPHQRSGEVFVDTVSYKNLDPDLAPNIAPELRSSSLAKQTLNELMLELDYLYRVKIKNEKSSLEVSLKLVQDVSGDFVISSQQDIIFVFEQMEDVLDWLGFVVVEEDKDLFSFKLTYEQNQQSMWDSVFNSDVANKLELPKGEYKLELNTTVDGVHIKFRDVANTPLNQAQMSEMFELVMKVVKEEDLEL